MRWVPSWSLFRECFELTEMRGFGGPRGNPLSDDMVRVYKEHGYADFSNYLIAYRWIAKQVYDTDCGCGSCCECKLHWLEYFNRETSWNNYYSLFSSQGVLKSKYKRNLSQKIAKLVYSIRELKYLVRTNFSPNVINKKKKVFLASRFLDHQVVGIQCGCIAEYLFVSTTRLAESFGDKSILFILKLIHYTESYPITMTTLWNILPNELWNEIYTYSADHRFHFASSLKEIAIYKIRPRVIQWRSDKFWTGSGIGPTETLDYLRTLLLPVETMKYLFDCVESPFEYNIENDEVENNIVVTNGSLNLVVTNLDYDVPDDYWDEFV